MSRDSAALKLCTLADWQPVKLCSHPSEVGSAAVFAVESCSAACKIRLLLVLFVLFLLLGSSSSVFIVVVVLLFIFCWLLLRF